MLDQLVRLLDDLRGTSARTSGPERQDLMGYSMTVKVVRIPIL
jgi:hypothetical protein